MSISKSFQGSCAGSFIAVTLIGPVPQSMRSLSIFTSPGKRPSRPLLALTAIRYGAQNSVAIGGTADIRGLEAAGGSIENDPQRR
jgi:hypothetical protein